MYIAYIWLLSLQVQFRVIRCIFDFRRPCTCCISETETANRSPKFLHFWHSLTSKWPSRASRPLGLLFGLRWMFDLIYNTSPVTQFNAHYLPPRKQTMVNTHNRDIPWKQVRFSNSKTFSQQRITEPGCVKKHPASTQKFIFLCKKYRHQTILSTIDHYYKQCC